MVKLRNQIRKRYLKEKWTAWRVSMLAGLVVFMIVGIIVSFSTENKLVIGLTFLCGILINVIVFS